MQSEAVSFRPGSPRRETDGRASQVLQGSRIESSVLGLCLALSPPSSHLLNCFICQVNKLSETGNLSAEVVAAAISPVSDDDFEALLGAEHLGRYFRDENGARFFANGELKGQYPED